ncbi:hypothetical protein ACI2K6_00680 [Microbacterium sp. NPDC006705]|uniref:FxLD family lantipeptide n=1 Tax=Microbacterium plantarum TaxID=1816425 RepID=A0ABV5ETL3_9MICO|nr:MULTISPECIES: hypothetical protein [Microbacterium]WJM14444.1 hypothetical protein QUC20_09030 [Microbacterium arborescens]WRK15966.1 hypothetical protein VC184_08465 [Microbacterium plantarum]
MSTASTPQPQTLQPVPDEKNLLVTANDDAGSCCGGGCCSTS